MGIPKIERIEAIKFSMPFSTFPREGKRENDREIFCVMSKPKKRNSANIHVTEGLTDENQEYGATHLIR